MQPTARPHPHSKSRAAGFTLIEVVLAIAILAISLTALYEIFGDSLRRAHISQRKELAWLTAQSLLSEVRGLPAIQVGERKGEEAGGMPWSMSVKPYGGAATGDLSLFEVGITVRWGTKTSEAIKLNSVEWGRANG